MFIFVYIYIYYSTFRLQGTLAQSSSTLVNGPSPCDHQVNCDGTTPSDDHPVMTNEDCSMLFAVMLLRATNANSWEICSSKLFTNAGQREQLRKFARGKREPCERVVQAWIPSTVSFNRLTCITSIHIYRSCL